MYLKTLIKSGSPIQDTFWEQQNHRRGDVCLLYECDSSILYRKKGIGFGFFCCACERGSPFMSCDPSIFPVIRALSEKFQGLLILNKERKAVLWDKKLARIRKCASQVMSGSGEGVIHVFRRRLFPASLYFGHFEQTKPRN